MHFYTVLGEVVVEVWHVLLWEGKGEGWGRGIRREGRREGEWRGKKEGRKSSGDISYKIYIKISYYSQGMHRMDLKNQTCSHSHPHTLSLTHLFTHLYKFAKLEQTEMEYFKAALEEVPMSVVKHDLH